MPKRIFRPMAYPCMYCGETLVPAAVDYIDRRYPSDEPCPSCLEVIEERKRQVREEHAKTIERYEFPPSYEKRVVTVEGRSIRRHLFGDDV